MCWHQQSLEGRRELHAAAPGPRFAPVASSKFATMHPAAICVGRVALRDRDSPQRTVSAPAAQLPPPSMVPRSSLARDRSSEACQRLGRAPKEGGPPAPLHVCLCDSLRGAEARRLRLVLTTRRGGRISGQCQALRHFRISTTLRASADLAVWIVRMGCHSISRVHSSPELETVHEDQPSVQLQSSLPLCFHISSVLCFFPFTLRCVSFLPFSSSASPLHSLSLSSLIPSLSPSRSLSLSASLSLSLPACVSLSLPSPPPPHVKFGSLPAFLPPSSVPLLFHLLALVVSSLRFSSCSVERLPAQRSSRSQP